LFVCRNGFAKALGALVTLDLMTPLFGLSSCSYSVSFQVNFLVYMFAVLFFLFLFIPLGVKLAKYVHRSDAEHLIFLNELRGTFIANFLQIIYPSICAKVFSIFNCVEIPSLPDGERLRLRYAYDVRCWSSVDGHLFFVGWAIFFMVIYVIAFPLGLFAVLYRNRQMFAKHHIATKTLRKLDVFHDLKDDEINFIIDKMEHIVKYQNQEICHQHDSSDGFFIIVKGSAVVTVDIGDGDNEQHDTGRYWKTKQKEIARLDTLGYFGETAL